MKIGAPYEIADLERLHGIDHVAFIYEAVRNPNGAWLKEVLEERHEIAKLLQELRDAHDRRAIR